MVRSRILLLLCLVGGIACAADMPLPAYVIAAVAAPARGSDKEADARRHPAELAVFAQVKPGDTVVDLIPGSGYFTRIFSHIVGPTGHVFAIWPAEYAKEDADNVTLTKTLAATPGFSNVAVLIQPAAHFSVPVKANVVWTSQNYHDYPNKFMGAVDPAVLNKAVYAALKSGGRFVVIDHSALAGSGMRDTDTLHRIDEQTVKTQITAAGFKLDGESDVLRNPADTRKIKVFDEPIHGHTDQFALRFRKP